MYLRFAYFLLLFFISATSFADEKIYSLGATTNTSFDTPTIYFPINTKNYIFEPSISLFIDSRKPVSSTITDTTSTESYDFGLGIFKKLKVTNKTVLYYGARLGYSFYKNDTSNTNSYDNISQSGFYIEPTFGTEYFLSLKFSAGLDFSMRYFNLETKYDSLSNGTNTSRIDNRTSLNTSAKIIFRYHF